MQHEVKMKSLSETVKDGEQRKRQLQEQIDQLNEECAKLAAQGPQIILYCHILTPTTTEPTLLFYITDSYVHYASQVRIM